MITIGLEGGRTDSQAEKRLKEYDNSLDLNWNFHKQRWIVTTKDKREIKYCVLIVQNEDGSYRNFDKRTMINIYEADLARKRRAEDLINEIEEHNLNLEAKQKKEISDSVREFAHDRWRSVAKIPYLNIRHNL